MLPWLSDEELADLCFPLTNGAAQVKFLQREGLSVSRKPGGRPLLMRSELERVKGAARFTPSEHNPPTQPNRAALIKVMPGGKRGAQTQRR